MEFKNILYTNENGVARITINRPERMNSLNLPTRNEILAVLDNINQDKSIKIGILTGDGDKAFIAGSDINELKDVSSTDMYQRSLNLGQQFFNTFENARVPFIAMINGFCLGGGCELAMCCDIRIASENAKFGQPEIGVGILPGGGGTQRLPRLVGWGIAKELIYTGKIIDAKEAARIGLVNRVVSSNQLETTVMQLAQSIATKSSIIIELVKRTMNEGMHANLNTGLASERTHFALCFTTEDHDEGINAFMEKRKPNFKGK